MTYAIVEIDEVTAPSMVSQQIKTNYDEDSSSRAVNNDTDTLTDNFDLSVKTEEMQEAADNEINKMMVSQLVQLFEKTKANVLQGYLSAHMASVSKIGQLTQSINQI
jgi:ABC-type uncharacterized transport system auxiliary subunit